MKWDNIVNKETRSSQDECSTGDQTIILGLQIFLDGRSSRTIDQKLWWPTLTPLFRHAPPTPPTPIVHLSSLEILRSTWGLFSSLSQVVRMVRVINQAHPSSSKFILIHWRLTWIKRMEWLMEEPGLNWTKPSEIWLCVAISEWMGWSS